MTTTPSRMPDTSEPNAGYKRAQSGMSLLDYFAGLAMAAVYSSHDLVVSFRERIAESDAPESLYRDVFIAMVAVHAYQQAEAMLDERERRMKKNEVRDIQQRTVGA